jgi:hypothetical protein
MKWFTGYHSQNYMPRDQHGQLVGSTMYGTLPPPPPPPWQPSPYSNQSP